MKQLDPHTAAFAVSPISFAAAVYVFLVEVTRRTNPVVQIQTLLEAIRRNR